MTFPEIRAVFKEYKMDIQRGLSRNTYVFNMGYFYWCVESEVLDCMSKDELVEKIVSLIFGHEDPRFHLTDFN